MPLISKHDKKNYINKMELKIRLATSKTSEEKIINEYYSGKEDEIIKHANNKEELDQRSVEIEDFKKKVKISNRYVLKQEVSILFKEISIKYKLICCNC